jgi:hypothetical protein
VAGSNRPGDGLTGMSTRQIHLTHLFLIAALLLGYDPACAEWIALEKRHQPQGKQTVYFDPDTIHREENWVTVWQLVDTKWMGEPPTPRFLSAKTHKQFDCARWRFRILAIVEFSRQMATGKSAGGYIENGGWQRIEPQGADQGLAEIACRKS